MRVINRRAKFDYKLFEAFEAGIALTGREVKAIRARRVSIAQAYAKVINGEVYLINANVTIQGELAHESTRARKLLLHKNQIRTILAQIKGKKLTIVPISLYTKGRLIKVKIALAKAKRKFEKKKSLQEADIRRDLERELKENA